MVKSDAAETVTIVTGAVAAVFAFFSRVIEAMDAHVGAMTVMISFASFLLAVYMNWRKLRTKEYAPYEVDIKTESKECEACLNAVSTTPAELHKAGSGVSEDVRCFLRTLDDDDPKPSVVVNKVGEVCVSWRSKRMAISLKFTGNGEYSYSGELATHAYGGVDEAQHRQKFTCVNVPVYQALPNFLIEHIRRP